MHGRSREGGDFKHLCFIALHRVSIRAPVKGAIRPRQVTHLTTLVSIRAPVKGAIRHMYLRPHQSSFNPRPREGGDFCFLPPQL